MYQYDTFDNDFVRERVAQFRGQVARRLSGALTEEEFKPLRLKNGVYLQLHAYMLRVAVPYGVLSTQQLRQLALIADRYDRGYGHITTRQNMQFNWPALQDIPDVLDLLADVGMHCIQTSGNCIRNVTADPLAGVAADEVADPRPVAELIRQWSSLHPEFDFLPRKFKLAVTGAVADRAALAAHDVGVQVVRHPQTGALGYRVLVGGGLGRTPILAQELRQFLPQDDLLAYLEAILRVYNLAGRRDNKYKARIKILVQETGIEAFSERVEAEFQRADRSLLAQTASDLAVIAARFRLPSLAPAPETCPEVAGLAASHRDFAAWIETNVTAHRQQGYAAVTVSLKPVGGIPGDITADQMRALADLADQYSAGEVRFTHLQNVVLPHVRRDALVRLWQGLVVLGLAAGNAGLITDIVSCPGLDYCALATARSIPVAQAISRRFADPVRQREIGPLAIKISGCINACGHHHLGAIGILGLEKSGAESYQLTIGGDASETPRLGTLLGPGIPQALVPDAVEALVAVYLAQRRAGETFGVTFGRLGLAPFRTAYLGLLQQGVSHAAA
ncbi:MAG: nitrite/sulfite reductase [Alphaproteobacteria bacterium]|nr:nitrite/sulfite reductase [Alphaproteobacteria bacterium]